MSSRVRTTVRSALVCGENGVAARSRCGLRSGEHLTVAPGLDRVRADRHDRVPGLEQRVDQPAVRSFERNGDPHRVAGQPAESGQQGRESIGGVIDGELRGDLPGGVLHAHGVHFGGPVDTDVEIAFGQGQLNNSLRRQRRLGRGDRIPGGH
jgi:hypothetical protein